MLVYPFKASLVARLEYMLDVSQATLKVWEAEIHVGAFCF